MVHAACASAYCAHTDHGTTTTRRPTTDAMPDADERRSHGPWLARTSATRSPEPEPLGAEGALAEPADLSIDGGLISWRYQGCGFDVRAALTLSPRVLRAATSLARSGSASFAASADGPLS